MQVPYRTFRHVEFRDTDAAGIMHFSTYFTYMEEAEHELLRSLGTSVMLPFESPVAGDPAADSPQAGGTLGWPRVAAECQYSGSARFEQQLEIEVRVTRLGRSSVTYGFRFRVDQQEIATGSLTSVCCRLAPGKAAQSMPIPERLREQLSQLVAP